MASPPHQQLLHHHSTEVSCDSSGDSNSVRVKINPKQLSCSSHPKHCKYSISSSCSSSGDSAGAPRRLGGGARLRRQKKLPQLFERASSRWWDPKFDSVNLEEACLERCFPQTQRRFRYALFYIGFACLLWSVYFAVHTRSKLIVMVAPALCFLAACVGFFSVYLHQAVRPALRLDLAGPHPAGVRPDPGCAVSGFDASGGPC